jgi:hypothetical protein
MWLTKEHVQTHLCCHFDQLFCERVTDRFHGCLKHIKNVNNSSELHMEIVIINSDDHPNATHPHGVHSAKLSSRMHNTAYRLKICDNKWSFKHEKFKKKKYSYQTRHIWCKFTLFLTKGRFESTRCHALHVVRTHGCLSRIPPFRKTVRCV